MTSRLPISALVRPSATALSTSSSRGVSAAWAGRRILAISFDRPVVPAVHRSTYNLQADGTIGWRIRPLRS